MPDLTPSPPSRTRRLLPPLLMLLAVAVLFIKPVILHRSFQDPGAFHHDLSYGGPTQMVQMRQLVDQGIPPLWHTQQLMGTPFIGLYLPGTAHPLTLIAFVLGGSAPWALLSALNSLLVALFAFLLFTRAGASDWGSAAAGFLTAMTGFIPWVGLIWCVALPVPWLLCWMWSAMGLLERPLWRRWLWNVAAGLGVALSGDAQITVQGAYILAAWFALYCLAARVALRRAALVTFLLAAAVAAAALAASVQFLPTSLYFHSAVVTRTLTLGDYASTYPRLMPALAAGGLLFTRLLDNLFLPLSIPLLLAAGLARRVRNPAFLAALALAVGLGLLALGGHSGLAALPFHLPMMKSFVRHYKWGVILQGPLFIGVALGFDALLELLRERRRAAVAAAVVTLLLAAALVATHTLLWSDNLLAAVAAALVLLIAALLVQWLRLRRPTSDALPAALFLLLAIDAGSYSLGTPFPLELPTPDPIYREYLSRLGSAGRSQVMYPWLAVSTNRINQPLPVQGTGYQGEYSIDSWADFPLRNHAYLLHAICPEVAQVDDDQFSRINFTLCFKSTDFITDRNRHLVNLAGLRYFFLQDIALSAADRFPILLDPALQVGQDNLAERFLPWRVGRFQDRPVLSWIYNPRQGLEKMARPGTFTYRRSFRSGDRLAGSVRCRESWPGWLETIASASGKSTLVYARVPESTQAETQILSALPGGTDGSLSFSVPPGTHGSSYSVLTWINPEIVAPARTLKYRAGDRVMVFENTEALGRARVVHRTQAAATVAQAHDLAGSPETFDPRVETILVGSTARPQDGPAPTPTETATIEEPNTNLVVARARLESPGWLALSDTWYPGWRAFDEGGRELRILLADISLRAVALPAGDHRVRFVYQPLDFEIGLWASLGCLLALASMLALRRVRPSPDDFDR